MISLAYLAKFARGAFLKFTAVWLACLLIAFFYNSLHQTIENVGPNSIIVYTINGLRNGLNFPAVATLFFLVGFFFLMASMTFVMVKRISIRSELLTIRKLSLFYCFVLLMVIASYLLYLFGVVGKASFQAGGTTFSYLLNYMIYTSVFFIALSDLYLMIAIRRAKKP